MPKFLPVPWIQWRRFRVSGRVHEKETGLPLAGMMVCAYDEDLVKHDYLGECETDADGRFDIRFTDADFKDALESHPDLFLCIFEPGQAEPIHDTSFEVRKNAAAEEYFEIEVSRQGPGSAEAG